MTRAILFPFNYQLIGTNAWEATNASYFILPYIEQGNLFSLFQIPTTAKAGQALGTPPAGAVGDATMWSQSWNGPMNTVVKSFICPSAVKAPNRSAISWGGPGSNYGWSTGSRVQVVWVGEAFNGIIAYQHERRMKDVTDGLSNTQPDPLAEAKTILTNYANGMPVTSEAESFGNLAARVKAKDPAKGEILEKGLSEIKAKPSIAQSKAKELLGKL